MCGHNAVMLYVGHPVNAVIKLSAAKTKNFVFNYKEKNSPQVNSLVKRFWGPKIFTQQPGWIKKL